MNDNYKEFDDVSGGAEYFGSSPYTTGGSVMSTAENWGSRGGLENGVRSLAEAGTIVGALILVIATLMPKNKAALKWARAAAWLLLGSVVASNVLDVSQLDEKMRVYGAAGAMGTGVVLSVILGAVTL
jgi:hypothetical protein